MTDKKTWLVTAQWINVVELGVEVEASTSAEAKRLASEKFVAAYGPGYKIVDVRTVEPEVFIRSYIW